MKSFLLLPPVTKTAGLLLVFTAIALYLGNGVITDRIIWYVNLPIVAYQEPFGPKQYLMMSRVPFYDTFVCLLLLGGMICIAFARCKNEDEYIRSMRLQAWLWAVLVNVGLACLSFLFFYGMSFFMMIAGNLFSLLALFIVRFYFLIYKSNQLKSL